MHNYLPLLDPRSFVGRDPIYRFLTRGNDSPFQVFLFALGAQTAYIFIYTLLPNEWFRFNVNPDTDLRLYVITVLVALGYAVITAAMWAFYCWQPSAYLRTLRQLNDAGVLGPATSAKMSLSAYAKSSAKDCRDCWSHFRTLLGPATLFFTGLAAVLLYQGGYANHWGALFLSLIVLNIMFFATMIAARQRVLARDLTSLPSFFEYRVVPFHHDGVCGSRAIGDFFLKSILVAAAAQLTLWLPTFLFISGFDDWFRNGEAFTLPSPLTVISGIALLSMVGRSFVTLTVQPIWCIHETMVRSRESALIPYSGALLQLSQIEPGQPTHPHFNEVLNRYNALKQELTTWPVSTSSVLGTGGALLLALTPSILALIGLLLR